MKRNEIIEMLLDKYIDCKKNDCVYGRDESRSTTLALGELLGFLMAHDLEYEETYSEIIIRTRIRDKVIATRHIEEPTDSGLRVVENMDDLNQCELEGLAMFVNDGDDFNEFFES